MNENQPQEEIAEQLEKARKLREMTATPGWKDIILPTLNKHKAGYEQQLLNTEWQTIDDQRKCWAKYNAIEEILNLIDLEISTAESIELESAVEAGEKNE